MTAPPQGPNVTNNHIANRAPSRHDNAGTARVSEVFLNVEYRLMIKQAIQHVRCLTLGGADRQDAEVAILVGEMALELRSRFTAVV